jgi:double-strand break repair protein AddB
MLVAHWTKTPPQDPIIVAGSTGSRGATMMLMQAVAKLPQGALVLPGYDFDTPHGLFMSGRDGLPPEDHPQYRFHNLMARLDLTPGHFGIWDDTPPPSTERNRLVSLSLRPAPVTDAWLTEGAHLSGIASATAGITLLQAPSPRKEAQAIALRLREAAQNGQKAAVITPDRMLTRQITAALDQWGILPDDSAGAPLHLSPPGRFLRHIAALFHRRLDAEALLTLLKHPLTHSGENRGAHALNTQRLELQIRKLGLPYPDPRGILELMRKKGAEPADQDERNAWAGWVSDALCHCQMLAERPLTAWVKDHITLAESLAQGQVGAGTGGLWQKKAGQEALRVMAHLSEQAEFGGTLSAQDYADLVGALLAEGEVRDRDAPHSDIMIWGTLEARVQGADLVILAGLNEGTWPEAPSPDPWLNRALRHKAGLLLPDRRIGLSAHDYQQAIGAREVWLSRSIRSDDAETVASRWINRLSNLLKGLETQGGPSALSAMQERGDAWLARAEAFEATKWIEPARRPAPIPPKEARLTTLSVTEIKHLIRDPYAIYAKRILKLRKIGALVQTPDALLRGTVAHEVVEAFVKESLEDSSRLTAQHLGTVAHRVLQKTVPWPAARALWQARLERIADEFVAAEIERQTCATPIAFEEDARGRLIWADLDFTLTGQADRIDQTDLGEIILYDYKSGKPPTAKQQAAFDKQLLIEAAMIEEGAFDAVEPNLVAGAFFLGLAAPPDIVAAPLDEEPPAQVLARLRQLIEAYRDPDQGFTSRRMMQKERFEGDYDLLARLGEWNETDPPVPEKLT